MSYTVLARKYRPQRFSEVIGQDHVTRTLKNAITQQRIAHGYIFSGHRGIGKTTIARILAMALNCRKQDKPTPEPCGECDSCTEVRAGNAVDVIEIDAATNRGIDEIRELREAARYRPARDRYKIYILDEAHQITDAAFNALLKTLEEPPGHIVFMMATTQPEDIPQTIRSRCQHFSFHAVKFDDIVGQLKSIAQQEKITVEEDALAVLAEAGDGSMRDALSIMDQAIACSGSDAKLTAEQVRGLVGSVSSEVLETLMRGVARNSSQEVLQLIDKLVTEGQSPMYFVKQLVRFLRNTMVAKISGAESGLLQISSDERKRVERVAEQFSEEDLARFLNIALRTHDELGYKQEQRFHLELGVLKMVHAQRLLPIEELLSQQPLGASSRNTITTPAAPRTSTPVATTRADAAAPFVRTGEAASPFESDRARKSQSRGPEMSAGSGAEPAVAAKTNTQSAAVTMIAAAVAIAGSKAAAATEDRTAEFSTPDPGAPAVSAAVDDFRLAIIAALEEADQGMMSTLLESGEWSAQENGHQIVIKVPKSEVMIEMSFGSDMKKLVNAAASKAAGHPMKVRLVPGGKPNATPQAHRSTVRATAANGGARSRASEDPLVKYMKEKFGAEIRTVIDQTDKI